MFSCKCNVFQNIPDTYMNRLHTKLP